MRDKYVKNKRGELHHVQPEIRNNFWQNTRGLFRNSFKLISEEAYAFTVDDQATEAYISGKTDHVIRVSDSDLSSATLEDKAICLEMTTKEVSQVVTQVKFQVDKLMSSINYAPVEYVGLLQNGPEWIAVLRKVISGKVFWTHVGTTPAFRVTNHNVTDIDEQSCREIACLIEHAYCTADIIADVINDPSKHPAKYQLYPINQYQRDDVDEDEDEDDHDAAEGYSEDFAVPGKVVRGAVPVSAKQSAGHHHQQQQKQNKNAGTSGSKKSRSDRNTAGSPSSSQCQEYFVLPLSIANVSRHASSVY